VIARFFIILFRPRKRIEETYLNYSTEHLFDNSYIIINYRFKNALWYRFGKHITLEKQIKIFNLKNFDKEFDFVVYGFFGSMRYKLKFEPQLTLDSSSFKTAFSYLNLKLEERTIPVLTHSLIKCEINKPNIKIPEIKINQPKIEILKITFNQNEFI
jgi:hypothetical protein